jgi:hypothetical protein
LVGFYHVWNFVLLVILNFNEIDYIKLSMKWSYLYLNDFTVNASILINPVQNCKKYSWLAPKFYWDEFETAYENSNGVAFLNCNLLTCSNLLIYSFGFVIAKMNTFA